MVLIDPGNPVKMPVVAKPPSRLVILLDSTISLAAQSIESMRAENGVVPAWVSRPLTVISNHLKACTPVACQPSLAAFCGNHVLQYIPLTIPTRRFSASKMGPCSIWTSKWQAMGKAL